MSLLIRFANHSFKHFFIRDIEGHRDGSYLFHISSLMVIPRLYKGSRLVNREMKASSALPACLHIRKEVVLDRPTLGWTVDEACLLGKVIYIL